MQRILLRATAETRVEFGAVCWSNEATVSYEDFCMNLIQSDSDFSLLMTENKTMQGLIG